VTSEDESKWSWTTRTRILVALFALVLLSVGVWRGVRPIALAVEFRQHGIPTTGVVTDVACTRSSTVWARFTVGTTVYQGRAVEWHDGCPEIDQHVRITYDSRNPARFTSTKQESWFGTGFTVAAALVLCVIGLYMLILVAMSLRRRRT
jgi:hypothetical protein